MAEFEEADQFLIELVEEVIKANHPHLAHASIGLMYRDEPAKSKGRRIYSKVKTMTDDMNVFVDYDFIIWFAKDIETMSEDTRQALVDHTLCYCGGHFDNWSLSDPDIQEFSQVLARHGYWSQQLQGAKKAIEQYEQGNFFDLVKKGEVIFGSVKTVEPALIRLAKEDPEKLSADLVAAAREFKEQNGGSLSISDIQRHFRIGYSHAQSVLEVLKNAGAEVSND